MIYIWTTPWKRLYQIGILADVYFRWPLTSSRRYLKRCRNWDVDLMIHLSKHFVVDFIWAGCRNMQLSTLYMMSIHVTPVLMHLSYFPCLSLFRPNAYNLKQNHLCTFFSRITLNKILFVNYEFKRVCLLNQKKSIIKKKDSKIFTHKFGIIAKEQESIISNQISTVVEFPSPNAELLFFERMVFSPPTFKNCHLLFSWRNENIVVVHEGWKFVASSVRTPKSTQKHWQLVLQPVEKKLKCHINCTN